MVSTQLRTESYRALILNSALEHPLVWDYIGKSRYLHAAASKSLARVYSDRFGTSTSKTLSNEAAESGSSSFLDWTRSIGCNWDESVFLSGVKGGRADILQHLIDNECPVPQGEEACTCAAKEGRLKALKWLRDKEFAWGDDVCSEAAARGDLPLLKWARRHECPFNWEDELAGAARAGHLNTLKWVLRYGGWLFTELTAIAAAGGRLHVLEWLRTQNCSWSVNTVWNAAASGHCDVLLWLKDAGCPYAVNAADTEGKAALHLAASNGHADMVRMLIADGAVVNQVMEGQKKTPLYLAALHGECEVVQLLVNAGAHIDAKGEDSMTALRVVAGNGSLDIVKILLRAGASTELGDAKGCVPLAAACRNNHVDVVRALLEAGANPNHHTPQSPSPLFMACLLSNVEVIRALTDCGADVSTPHTVEEDGDTSIIYPIHVAVNEGCAQIVSILIKCVADVNVSFSQGETPLSLACAGNYTEVIGILVAAGARL